MGLSSPHMVILLIDGNNLAHFLYTNLASGQKMTQADSLRLINHLASYARQNGQAVDIECCLDRPVRHHEDLPENLRILASRYPKTADDLLLDRFWFHRYSQRPCLVVTNDEAILNEVTSAKGSTLPVSTFVRRAGTHNPVFREPAELLRLARPIQLPMESMKPQKEESSRRSRINSQTEMRSSSIVEQTRSDLQDETVAKTEIQIFSACPEEILQQTGAANDDGPYYSINLERWPAAEGIRFLIDSFCTDHRADILDLFRSIQPADFTSADLCELAQLLISTCAGEPDFVMRGGSLMDRVRLALLQANGEELSITQLAILTGLRQTGLRGRIKAKAGRWVDIREGGD